MTNDLAIQAPQIWDLAKAIKTNDRQAVLASVAAYEAMIPLYDREPRLNGPLSEKLRKWIKPIGMKGWPTMQDQAKSEWLNAMLLALSDLPAEAVIASLKRAVHQPFRFHNEVEPWVRADITETVERGRSIAKMIEWQASRPPVEQTALEEPGKRWTQAEVDDANATFAAIKIPTRYRLVGDQVEIYEDRGLDDVPTEAH